MLGNKILKHEIQHLQNNWVNDKLTKLIGRNRFFKYKGNHKSKNNKNISSNRSTKNKWPESLYVNTVIIVFKWLEKVIFTLILDISNNMRGNW